MQPACAILSCVACLALQNSSTISHKQHDFREKVLCILIFSVILSETFLILRRIQRDTIINAYWSSCKVAIILVRFKWNIHFSTDVRKMLKYQISRKFVQWDPSCSMRTNEANSRFSQLCEHA